MTNIPVPFFKRLRSPGIDTASLCTVALRAGTVTLLGEFLDPDQDRWVKNFTPNFENVTFKTAKLFIIDIYLFFTQLQTSNALF